MQIGRGAALPICAAYLHHVCLSASGAEVPICSGAYLQGWAYLQVGALVREGGVSCLGYLDNGASASETANNGGKRDHSVNEVSTCPLKPL